jgi:deoxyribose-phosphate aldolase
VVTQPTFLRIAIGADHGGFELKERIKADLQQRGHAVEDCGTHGTDAVDYPDFAHAVARRVASGAADCGIMVDRAGIGSAMAANKLPGVRAALCYDLSSARNSREHNNANVLTLGAGLVGPDLALQIVQTWLATKCSVERHLRRAAKIEPASEAVCTCGAAPSRETAASGTARLEEFMPDLTDQDIERIVQRITALSGAEPAPACSNLACALCQVCAETNPDFVRQLVGMGADRVHHRHGGGDIPSELARHIDHTLLRPDTTAEEIDTVCDEARQYGFASVCVHPSYVRRAAQRLKGSRVPVCCVVGFPHGANAPETKALEARRAIRDGAREIDMVINIGALKSGDDALVLRDIRAVTDACMDGGALCKVILETAMLSDDEKVRACQLAKQARADFVKTSTGFGGGGATAHDVALMADAIHGTRMQVKASGGIRSYAEAQEMIQAGATRLGASAGVKILKQAKGLTVSEDGGNQKY